MATEMQDKPKQPTLEDVGTRYEHFSEHKDALEALVESLSARPNASSAEKQVLIKLRNAADVMKSTIDSMAGLTGTTAEYQIYRLINSAPKDPTTIEGERGTPLC